MRKKMFVVIITIVAFGLFIPNVMAVEVKTQEEFYATIEEGKKVDIKSNFNIKLQEDVTITSKVTIGVSYGEEVSMIIDLNGHTINLNGSSAQLYVQTKGKLVVEDSLGGGLITNKGATGYNPYPIQIAGNCEVNGGTLENTLSSNYALYTQNATSTCMLNNGTIINSYDKGGKAVYNKGTFIMNGGKVVNKAAGNPGYAAAIEGHTIIMNGGEIEAAGTGIVATGSNVEITGGTINAGWYGLLTRYAIVNPAEGKQVNIKAGKAVVMAYSAPKEGIGNKIYGGNFDAPIFVKGYASEENANNIEVHGGIFTPDVSEYVVDGKYAEKVGTNYEIKEYTQNIGIVPIDPTEEVEDATVGLTKNEETEETLMESLDEALASDITSLDKGAVKNNHVVVAVDITSIKKDELDDEVVDKFEKVSKNLVIADYFDISVLVNDNNNKNLGFIPQLTKDIELVILLPEKYINTDENVNRMYYVIREHDGQVEILNDVELSEDGKSIIFKSNKFSTYALAYEDVVKTVGNPVTYDGIGLYFVLVVVSLSSLVILSLYTKNKKNI